MAGAGAALLLAVVLCTSGSTRGAPQEWPPKNVEPECKGYFTGLEGGLQLCKDALMQISNETATNCPWQCNGVFKGMPPLCAEYLDPAMPQTYRGEMPSQLVDDNYDQPEPFNICEALYCPDQACGIALEVLRNLQLFNLPGVAQQASVPAAVNVGAIVAGVVVGNALILMLVGGVFWLRRQRSRRRLKAEQRKALDLAPTAPGGPVKLAAGGNRPSSDLDSAEQGGVGKKSHWWPWGKVGGDQVAPAAWSPGGSSPNASSKIPVTEHMQQDEVEMMGLGSSASQPFSVQSDPVLSWVNTHVQQQQQQQGGSSAAHSILAPGAAGGSADSLAPPPPAGDSQAPGGSEDPPGGSSSGELQGGGGSDTPLGTATPSAAFARRRSSGWITMDSGRSSGLVDLKPWQLKYSELKMLRALGEGSFGKVFLATWNETLVAVKVLLAADGPTDSNASAVSLPLPVMEELQKEAGLMASLRHPNVVLFLGVCSQPPAVVTEYCARGSLLDVLRGARASEQAAQQLTWVRRLSMALDAAKGMLCLHAHSPPILHRDLKSPNLLVDSAWRVKVCDFNLSKIMEESVKSSSAGGLLNPRWLAPEVLMGENATAASDVFSFGTVLWELLTLQLPWEGANLYQLVFMVSRGERLAIPVAEDVPGVDQLSEYDAYVSLLRRCWEQQPQQRPEFGEIIMELRAIMSRVVMARPGTPS